MNPTPLSNRTRITLFLLVLLLTLTLGCAQLATRWPERPVITVVSSTQIILATRPPDSQPETYKDVPLRLWIAPTVPNALRQTLTLPAGVALTESEADATLVLTSMPEGETAWVYALVAPFPTIADGVELGDLSMVWGGAQSGVHAGAPLSMTPDTQAAFESLWGAQGQGSVRTMAADALLENAWGDLSQPFWAIVPFEELDPRWKVLRVNGLSPFDKNLDLASYPLTVRFGIQGSDEAITALRQISPDLSLLPASNRDESKLTTLVMTGVTALVRSTGAKMEVNGMTYPGRDIRDWLRNADLTHISNEIAFTPICPPANPYQDSLQFCSRPEYIELLEDVGADIIDMTGNHMLDYNQEPLLYTLDMYRERGWLFYASGETLAEAKKAVTVENNGNRLAFIGCNPVGPTHAWATDYSAGIAPCDYEYMHAEITRLRNEGYLPIVTFQYHEYYTPEARPGQVVDFEGMAEAGAVVVSGSQAHVPQAFGFYGDGFIHYGLGNLFFDQMDIPVVGTKREFIDRHIFYQGRYLGVELLTAMLEDYARPRPMTAEERESLLGDIFAASDWSGVLRKDNR